MIKNFWFARARFKFLMIKNFCLPPDIFFLTMKNRACPGRIFVLTIKFFEVAKKQRGDQP